jgi:hypothetical protein
MVSLSVAGSATTSCSRCAMRGAKSVGRAVMAAQLM